MNHCQNLFDIVNLMQKLYWFFVALLLLLQVDIMRLFKSRKEQEGASCSPSYGAPPALGPGGRRALLEVSYVKTSPHQSQAGDLATQIEKFWGSSMTSSSLYCSAV